MSSISQKSEQLVNGVRENKSSEKDERLQRLKENRNFSESRYDAVIESEGVRIGVNQKEDMSKANVEIFEDDTKICDGEIALTEQGIVTRGINEVDTKKLLVNFMEVFLVENSQDEQVKKEQNIPEILTQKILVSDEELRQIMQNWRPEMRLETGPLLGLEESPDDLRRLKLSVEFPDGEVIGYPFKEGINPDKIIEDILVRIVEKVQ